MENLSASKIIQLLEKPTDDRRSIVHQVQADASTKEILLALQESSSELVCTILCDILGERHDVTSVAALLDALQDEYAGVRSAAADALAKIGDARSGDILMKQFEVEGDVGVRQMIVLALGAVRHRPASQLLIKTLTDSDGTLRGCAAWSLGALRAKEAKEALQDALIRETDSYALTRVSEALEEVLACQQPPPPQRS